MYRHTIRMTRRVGALALVTSLPAFSADCRGATGPDPSGPPAVSASASPSASAPVAAAATPAAARDGGPPACPADMTEVRGNYCTDLRHWCLEGYPTIGGSWTTYYPNGALGVTYCEKYVVGRAECAGRERPLRFCIDTYEYPGRGERRWST